MGKAAISELMGVVPGADMALMSQAKHKYEGFVEALLPYPVIPTQIRTPRGLPEPDVPDLERQLKENFKASLEE